MAKRTVKKTTKAITQIVTQVRLDVKPDTPSYYVNYMGVSQTAFDFTIGVARIPSQLTTEQAESVKKGEPLVLETILHLIVPPLLIDGLINALTDQKKKYDENLAKVKKNEPKQQHIGPGNTVH